jgi:WD40 repeat protein
MKLYQDLRMGRLRVWDITEKRYLKTFSGHEDRVVSIACSPDSSFIASGSHREVKIFNLQTGNVFRTIPTDNLVESVRFLGQDRIMYATDQSKFVIHDLTKKTNLPKPAPKNWLNRCFQGAQVRFELLQGRIRRSKTNPTKNANVLIFDYQGDTTVISSDGTFIASQYGKVVKIWQTDSPSPNHDMASHGGHVKSVAFSGDGKLVASGSRDNTVKLWDPTTGRCLHTFAHPDQVTSVIFSPNSTLLASASFDRKIRIWDTRTHDLIFVLGAPERDIGYYHFSLGLSPDGNRLVSLRVPFYQNQRTSRYLELWEIATGKCLASMELDRYFDKVAFGVDGTSIILENNDQTMRCSISPSQSTSDHMDYHSSLPMKFIPLHDPQQSVPTHLHHYRRRREWILDEQKRRVLWVPPDLRHAGDSYEKKVVLGSHSGRVPIVDISDV